MVFGFMSRTKGHGYAMDRARAAEASSRTMKRRKKSPAHVAKVMQSRKENGTNGGWHDPEIRAQRKAKMQELGANEEFRRNVGKSVSEAYAQRKASGKPHWRAVNSPSDETRRKLSEAMKASHTRRKAASSKLLADQSGAVRWLSRGFCTGHFLNGESLGTITVFTLTGLIDLRKASPLGTLLLMAAPMSEPSPLGGVCVTVGGIGPEGQGVGSKPSFGSLRVPRRSSTAIIEPRKTMSRSKFSICQLDDGMLSGVWKPFMTFWPCF